MTTRIEDIGRLSNGSLPSFTSIGGYPLVYYTANWEELCASCALKNDDDLAVLVDVYYEGPPKFCTDCGDTIESAYGDPDNDQ